MKQIFFFFFCKKCPNDADKMAKGADPDQTAPLGAVGSGSAQFAETYFSQYLEFLSYTLYVETCSISCNKAIHLFILCWP